MFSIVMKSMTTKVFFDTNVLLYAFDIQRGTASDLRTEKAEDILNHGGVVSVQVVNEFVDVVSRKSKLSWEKIADLLQVIEVLCGCAIPLTVETHKAAIELSRRYSYRIYDSLILASAAQAGCTTVYSEDMQHGQTIGKLTIVNPFLAQ
jgi:predicted nucleic acid-binding protein